LHSVRGELRKAKLRFPSRRRDVWRNQYADDALRERGHDLTDLFTQD
jgi:hypothetical protein